MFFLCRGCDFVSYCVVCTVGCVFDLIMLYDAVIFSTFGVVCVFWRILVVLFLSLCCFFVVLLVVGGCGFFCWVSCVVEYLICVGLCLVRVILLGFMTCEI